MEAKMRTRKGKNGAGNTKSNRPTTEQIISGMFKIKPADVKRIVASKPAKKRKK